VFADAKRRSRKGNTGRAFWDAIEPALIEPRSYDPAALAAVLVSAPPQLPTPAPPPKETRAHARTRRALERESERTTTKKRKRQRRRSRDAQARIDRANARKAKHLDRARIRRNRWYERAAARGLDVSKLCQQPAYVSRDTWVMRCDVLSDGTHEAPRTWLERCSRTHPHAAGAIRRAALVPLPDGTTLYRWSDLRAKRVAVVGMILLMESRRVSNQRNLRDRHGRWAHVTTGLSIEYLRALLADPFTGEKPSRSALVGWHEGQPQAVALAFRSHRPLPDGGIGALLDGQLGYLPALKVAGFCYSRQPRPELGDQLFPDEIGTESGFATTRYFIVGRPVDATLVPERHRAHMAALESLGWTDLGDDERATRKARERWRWELALECPEPIGPAPD
jgi:hypothetical protein